MKTSVRDDPQLAFNLPGDDVGQNERALNANRRLLILACSRIKTPDGALPTRDPAAIPALKRYDGPLWQTLRSVQPHARHAHIAFLSARFGFRLAHAHIKDYDQQLTPKSAARLIAGGINAKWPPADRRWSCASGEIALLGVSRKKPILDVAMVGGQLYLEVMRSFVAEFQTWGRVSSTARITEINGPIGVMRQELRAWVEYPPARCQFEELLTESRG